MSDPTKKADDASARFNRAVSETTERLEKEAADFVKYVNDSVVPNVRQQSTKALRMLVSRGSRYSTVTPVAGLIRTARSLCMPPVQMSPLLSTVAR